MVKFSYYFGIIYLGGSFPMKKASLDNLLLVIFLLIYGGTSFLIDINPFIGISSLAILILFLSLGVIIPIKLFKRTGGVSLLVGITTGLICYGQLIVSLDNYSSLAPFLGMKSTILGLALFLFEALFYMYLIEDCANWICRHKKQRKEV